MTWEVLTTALADRQEAVGTRLENLSAPRKRSHCQHLPAVSPQLVQHGSLQGLAQEWSSSASYEVPTPAHGADHANHDVN